MQNFPTLETLELLDKKVLLRADLDIDVANGLIVDTARLDNAIETINALFDRQAKQITVIGHRGRPEGVVNEEFSLQPVADYFKEKVTPDIFFAKILEDAHNPQTKLVLLENLRFWPGEESNDPDFAGQLKSLGDVYVNDAFASSHREHASIVGLTTLPSALGLQFKKEIENLSKVYESPEHPVIAIISGAKNDKLDYLEKFKSFCDKVLIGGRLPEFLGDDYKDEKVIVARLLPDKEDITIHSMEHFEAAIRQAGTIIFAGPIGLYEDNAHTQGTKRILEAIAQNKNAFKIAGGGDTQAAIKTFGYANAFDWISSGGGASLDFLANKTLPGLTALIH